METVTKVDIIFKLVGIVGGLITAFKIMYELQENRKQKEKDLRWKQAKAAQELITQFLNNKLAYNATLMFDWADRVFEISPENTDTIDFEDIKASLRTTNLQFTEKEVFIRDCVDAFLFQVEYIEQSIENGLIEFRDVKFPMEYFIKVINQHNILKPLKSFIKQYNYNNSDKFIERFG